MKIYTRVVFIRKNRSIKYKHRDPSKIQLKKKPFLLTTLTPQRRIFWYCCIVWYCALRAVHIVLSNGFTRLLYTL